MTKLSKTVFGSILFVGLTGASVAGGPTTLSWCKTATVTGTLKKGTTQHPNGSKLVFHYVALKEPITVAAGECEGIELERTTAKEVQVKEDPKVMGKLVGKAVTVSGELASPANAYDVLSAILYPPITVKAE